MAISDRIESTIERWTTQWKERLRGFLINVLSFGIETFSDTIGKAAAPKLKPLIDKINSTGEVPPELQPLLNEIENPTGEVSAMLAQSAGGALVGGAVGKILDALLLPLAYAVNRLTRNTMPSIIEMINMWLRKSMSDEELSYNLASLGLPDFGIEWFKKLAEIRFDPINAIILWRRYNEKWGKYLEDLKEQGWDDERIEALKDATKAFPTLSDVINFYAKEAFEPDMITRYGLEDELPAYTGTYFEKLGIPEDVATKYWIAHWVHPAFREVTAMLHRGMLTEQDVYEWFRVVEIPPYWRDKLTEISWDLPNRIELRMMARYGLVDKSFLVEQLKQVGLKEEFREVAADMMLAMGIRTDLATRYGKGWITADEVRSELTASGMLPEVQERMYQWIVKNTGTDRVEAELSLTKAEIIKGVKKKVITRAQGVELLMRLGRERWEAEFMLDINIEVASGSPDSYIEFRKLTEEYRRSQGKDAKIPSEDLIQAGKSITRLEKEIAEAKEDGVPESEIQKLQTSLEATKLAYHQLMKTSGL